MRCLRIFCCFFVITAGAKLAPAQTAENIKDLKLRDWEPRSMLKTRTTVIETPAYPVIDVHNHLGGGKKFLTSQRVERYLAEMNSAGIRTVVNLDGGWDTQLKETLQALDEAHPGRFLTFALLDFAGIDDEGWSERESRRLEESFKAGAKGLKFHKTFGLHYRYKNGKLMQIDDPKLDPIWDLCAKYKRPVVIHTSDPAAFFTPLDRFNERWHELNEHPNWLFYGERFPSREELHNQRNCVIAGHPKTTFICAHFCNNPEDLATVGKWLDAYPNMYTDIDARISELGRQPYSARRFLLKYQDRIMFGTDTPPKRDAYRVYFRFLETDDEYFDSAASHHRQGFWMIYGIFLPKEVLAKVYYKNAERLLYGLPPDKSSANLTPRPTLATEPFELRDGDRVVFLGSTFIEREQRYGYWEHVLTCWWPERNVTFRNLGWSGDTVWGEARAGFDTPREGYRRLIEQTLALKPTVLFIGYGTNESFAGKAGLVKFKEQLNRLLDDLQPSQARVVLLAPPMFEKESWPGGQFAEHKADLEMYTQAIRHVADDRQIGFVPEFCQAGGPASPLTDDGMHLTAHGYRFASGPLVALLKIKEFKGSVLVELEGQTSRRLLRGALGGSLPPPDSPKDHRQYDSFIVARNLKPGKYTLKIDGRAVHTADADTWMHPEYGVVLVRDGPSIEQSEKLRQTIVAKNRLFFDRYRPQNETYLFGFRKYEQGQNAKEIAEFDPLVAKLEKEIAQLRKPVPHTYQLVPAEAEKK